VPFNAGITKLINAINSYLYTMKQSIQSKIEQIKELARTQHLAGKIVSAQVANDGDNLLKAIRNKEEATVFMAELDAAIKVSKKN
jgi:hypothetical protein